MGGFVFRLARATSTIFFSLLLGALALAYVAVSFPEFMESLLAIGQGVKTYLTSMGIPSKYNVWVKFLLGEQQLVYMGFVIVMRIAVALLFALPGAVLHLLRGGAAEGTPAAPASAPAAFVAPQGTTTLEPREPESESGKDSEGTESEERPRAAPPS